MPYPPRAELKPLPEFASTASSRPDPQLRTRVEAFVLDQYAAGRSLRELAELTDRSHSGGAEHPEQAWCVAATDRSGLG